MLKVVKLMLVLASVTYVSGCTFMASNYGASVENVTVMKGLGDTKIALSEFTSSKPGVSSIACRGAGPVSTPNKEPFEKYIQNAFESELKLAGLYSADSPIVFSGHFTKIDFNSNIGAGKWVFEVTASANNADSISISSKHEFSTNWVAEKACQQVAQAFSPAVQTLIRDIITNPLFENLIRRASK